MSADKPKHGSYEVIDWMKELYEQYPEHYGQSFIDKLRIKTEENLRKMMLRKYHVCG